MLRVLLIILSIVVVVLAIALEQPLLFILALGLLAGSATLTTARMKKRHADIPESFMKAPEEPVEELSSLGILEIKPKSEPAGESSESVLEEGADSEPPGDLFGAVADDGTHIRPEMTEQARPSESQKKATHGSISQDIVGEVRTRKPRTRIMVAEVAPGQDADVLIPALRSLRAGLDAYTVCLLRQEESPLRYHVEAIVSQNSYARGQGSFAANEPLLAGHGALVPVVYAKVGADGFPNKKLGYYHEPISVRQVAMVPVSTTEAHDPYLLVVDTMKDGSLESASVRALLEQYARLFSTLHETAARGELGSQDVEPSAKPRRDIISDEMERARSMSHPLALALVFLNRGEGLDETDSPKIHEMENAFEARLREVASDGRVEQFGELTYGVFYHGEEESVASWASHLQTSFVDERGHLQGGVSVGVVMMQERHKSPDDLRSDATAALQEAFDTGECTIVE